MEIRAFSNDIQRSPVAARMPASEFELLFRKVGKPVFYLELAKRPATG